MSEAGVEDAMCLLPLRIFSGQFRHLFAEHKRFPADRLARFVCNQVSEFSACSDLIVARSFSCFAHPPRVHARASQATRRKRMLFSSFSLSHLQFIGDALIPAG